jgi:hypothetical protein
MTRSLSSVVRVPGGWLDTSSWQWLSKRCCWCSLMLLFGCSHNFICQLIIPAYAFTRIRVWWGYKYWDPYPYPSIPVALTRAGSHTRGIHYLGWWRSQWEETRPAPQRHDSLSPPSEWQYHGRKPWVTPVHPSPSANISKPWFSAITSHNNLY